MARIAIHGFGRIGRSLMKVALKNDLFVPVSISDIKDLAALAALFEVDSNYGRWPEEVSTKDNCFVIGGRAIPYFDSSRRQTEPTECRRYPKRDRFFFKRHTAIECDPRVWYEVLSLIQIQLAPTETRVADYVADQHPDHLVAPGSTP